MEKHFRFFLIRFRAEQYKLLDWAMIANISEQDDILLINDMNRSLIVNVLDEQYRLMMRFGKLDRRYKPLAQPLLLEEYSEEAHVSGDELSAESSCVQFPQTSSLLKRALAFANSTTKYPLRLRWVVYDSAKAEELLSRLTSLNNFLHQILNSREREALRLQESRTHYQIVQLNTKIDQLLDIVEAGYISLHDDRKFPGSNAPGGLTLPMDDLSIYESGNPRISVEHLVDLARFKALATASDTGVLNGDLRGRIRLWPAHEKAKPFRLKEADLELDYEQKLRSKKRRSGAWYHSGDDTRQRHRIWIEWRSMALQPDSDDPDPQVVRRLGMLVDLLQQNRQTIRLRSPPCLGYCYLRGPIGSKSRYGLAFQNPVHVDPEFQPISLRERISDARAEIPSLTDRVALMRILTQCVEKLHAVDWLHKGLRSDNVLFFGPDLNHIRITDPYLSGFDFSRPTESASMSESPGVNLLEDLYRHPSVQGRPTERLRGAGFRKHHDIFSLGIILLEIAYWKPIEGILGFLDIAELRVLDVLRARETLLAGSSTRWLTSHLGDSISTVIMACIEGSFALGISEQGKNEGAIFEGAKLQERFYEIVVTPLINIRI